MIQFSPVCRVRFTVFPAVTKRSQSSCEGSEGACCSQVGEGITSFGANLTVPLSSPIDYSRSISLAHTGNVAIGAEAQAFHTTSSWRPEPFPYFFAVCALKPFWESNLRCRGGLAASTGADCSCIRPILRIMEPGDRRR